MISFSRARTSRVKSSRLFFAAVTLARSIWTSRSAATEAELLTGSWRAEGAESSLIPSSAS